ncbi:MAG: hypothetical protein JRH16_21065 [Deltaproteobacteria bacterium]|nr:hypothetical protein [Deltaproteobacteria bacterium]
MKQSTLCLVAVCAAACSAVAPRMGPVPQPGPSVGDGGVPAFYTFESRVPGTPGQMLRSESSEARLVLEQAAGAERFLYTSTEGIDGETPIVVSGEVQFPKGDAPEGGWPIVAWAHGSVGVADVCAPSLRGRSRRDHAYLNGYLEAGFAIVATDYQGLGTAGPHPYLTLRPVGYGVLDSVRAALARYPQLANRVFVVGQSQGSQATLAAAYWAPLYAPEVELLGAVATGLAASIAEDHPAPKLEPVWPVQGEGNYIASAVFMLQYLGSYPAIDPGFDPKPHVAEELQSLYEAGRTGCLGPEMAEVANRQRITLEQVLAHPVSAELQARLDRWQYFSFAQAKITVPVFSGSGLADTLAPAANHYNHLSAMCHQGTLVEFHYYDGHTHNSAVQRSQRDALPFMRKLLAGEAVESNCSELHPPGPIQDALY